ncbi:hypothetical protein BT93_F3181 [Corymbia citriodora subsp. variegata]|nr:hypothetical protein BT93_F3181 [Corymbia citriodora subsp. variegata]
MTTSGSVSGDIAGLALHSCAKSRNESINMPLDNTLEEGIGLPVQEDSLLNSHRFKSPNPTTSHVSSPMTLSVVELKHPSPVKIVHHEDEKQGDGEELPLYLKHISHLLHLAAFGILGVLNRYLLQNLFGPRIAGVTSDQTILYLDLPSNMVGSFLMGWLGVVFKEDVSSISEYLAIGLTTGYLGSLTTFSGWNQKMIDLAINRHWLFAVLGFLLGLFLAAYSIIFVVETAMGFRWLLRRIMRNSGLVFSRSSKEVSVDRNKCHFAISVVVILMLASSYAVSGIMLKKGFEKGGTTSQLWIACLVGPAGVWIRWFLARLNGRGLGKAAWLKWVPFGTLMANVSASCGMATLSRIKKEVNTKNCDNIVMGVQMGFLGCLSTVSTFIGEFNAMRHREHPWHAYAYAFATIFISFYFWNPDI